MRKLFGIRKEIADGHSGWRYLKNEETAPLRFSRVGGTAHRCGLSPEMHGLRAPDHDPAGKGGEECARSYAAGHALRKQIAESFPINDKKRPPFSERSFFDSFHSINLGKFGVRKRLRDYDVTSTFAVCVTPPAVTVTVSFFLLSLEESSTPSSSEATVRVASFFLDASASIFVSDEFVLPDTAHVTVMSSRSVIASPLESFNVAVNFSVALFATDVAFPAAFNTIELTVTGVGGVVPPPLLPS